MDKLIEIWNGRLGLIVTICSIIGMLFTGGGWYFDSRYFKKEVRRDMKEDSLFRVEMKRYMKCSDSAWMKQVNFNGQVQMFMIKDMQE